MYISFYLHTNHLYTYRCATRNEGLTGVGSALPGALAEAKAPKPKTYKSELPIHFAAQVDTAHWTPPLGERVEVLDLMGEKDMESLIECLLLLGCACFGKTTCYFWLVNFFVCGVILFIDMGDW